MSKITTSSTRQPDVINIWQLAKHGGAILLAITITLFIIGLRDTISEYATYGYPGIFIISVLGNATLIFPAPSFTIVFAVGGVLNPYLVAGCGAAVGEMTGYLAGYGGQEAIEKRTIYQQLNYYLEKWNVWPIFLLGLIPNPFFDIGGILAGVLKMPWWQFWLAAAAGKSLRFVGLALVGASVLGS